MLLSEIMNFIFQQCILRYVYGVSKKETHTHFNRKEMISKMSYDFLFVLFACYFALNGCVSVVSFVFDRQWIAGFQHSSSRTMNANWRQFGYKNIATWSENINQHTLNRANMNAKKKQQQTTTTTPYTHSNHTFVYMRTVSIERCEYLCGNNIIHQHKYSHTKLILIILVTVI